MIFTLNLLIFGLVAGVLIVEDMRRFEIKLEILPVLASTALLLNVYLGGSLVESLLAGSIWGGGAFGMYLLRKGCLGQGDIWLYLTAGFVFGLAGTLWIGALLMALNLLTAFAYARARNKRFGSSMFPAALPVGLAMLAVVTWRVAIVLIEDSAFDITSAATLALPGFGALLGAWIQAVRLSASDASEVHS